jgi:hypothetical protein
VVGGELLAQCSQRSTWVGHERNLGRVW